MPRCEPRRLGRPEGSEVPLGSRRLGVRIGAHDLDGHEALAAFDYHDFGHIGVDRARMNRAIFDALKPGGQFVIADHSGRPGTGISESGTLHRVEEAFVQREVEAAGFRLVARGDFMRNPSDPRDRNTPNSPMPRDEFVLKFAQPE
jgi:predicted methyltransferase